MTITTAADEFYALLAVIADPAAAKARLDELVAQDKATQERIDALNEMAHETVRLNATAQATNIVSDNRKKALDAREAEIGERAKQLDLATSAQKQAGQQVAQQLQQRQSNLDTRETTLRTLEASLAEREEAVKSAEEAAAALTEKVQRQAAAVQVALTQ